MVFLISMAVALLFTLIFDKLLKKHAAVFYIAAVCIAVFSAVSVWAGVRFPAFVQRYVMPVFARGGLAGAFFVIVMYMGALPAGSRALKKLMPVRGELSIIASILTLGHNFAYGKTYFVYLFIMPARLPWNQKIAAICSLVMIVIMLPLFVTSFKCIRKKMNPKKWKKLQRHAYGFYALLCTHIMLLTIPYAIAGRTGYRLTVVVYAATFASYLACKIMRAVIKQKKTAVSTARRIEWAAGCAAAVCAAVIAATAFHSVDTAKAEQLSEEKKTASENVMPVEDESKRENEENASENVENEETDPTVTEAPEDEAQESGAPEKTVEESPYIYNNGTFTGKSFGNSGDIIVEVTIFEDVITGVEVVYQDEDEPYWTWALDVIDSIVAANSTDVDTISGATFSADGILDAVSAALKAAER